jgi:hypothetical protein
LTAERNERRSGDAIGRRWTPFEASGTVATGPPTSTAPCSGALDETLDPRRFIRIHRSAIVNIDVVAELRQDAHADYVAVLRDRTEIRVDSRFRARLQGRLGQQL